MMIGMKTSYALLVIDMQLVAFDGKITLPIVDGSRLLDRVSTLVDVCRVEEIPIIYLQTCALSGQPYARDAHGWEIHPPGSRRSWYATMAGSRLSRSARSSG